MSSKNIFIRVFLVLAILCNNSRMTIVNAATLSPFIGFNQELINLSASYWDLSSMEIIGESISATGNEASSNFVTDLSAISASIDEGNLAINFSANVSIVDEPGELDLASITIGFGSTSTEPDSTVVLDRTTDTPGSALTLSSNASIPVGTRYLFVRPASNGVGSNNSAVFSAFTLKINDTLNPSLNYSLSPASWTNSNVEVTLNASDGESGIAGIYNEAESQVSSTSTHSFTVTENGSWIFTTRDHAGNVSDSLTVSVTTIDRVAPEAPVLTPETTDWSDAAVGFTLSEITVGAGEAPITRQIRYNSGEWQTYAEPASVNFEGQTLLEARTIDEAGNSSEIVQSTIKVDMSAPAIELSSDAHPQPTGGITITATITDLISGLASTKYASGSQTADFFTTGGSDFSGNSFELSVGGTYTIFAKDNAGNSSVEEITVNSYPTMGLIENQTINEDASAEVVFSVSDGETTADALSVSAISDNLSLFPNLSPTNVGGTVSLNLVPAANQNGSAVITVTVTDGGSLSTNTNINVTVNSVNDAPQATNDTFTTDEDAMVEISPLGNDSDPDGDLIIISNILAVSGGQADIIDSGTKIRFTPPANENGSFSITYEIQDPSMQTSSAVATVSVTAINDAPVITSIPDQNIDEDGTTGAISFTVSDVDGPSVVVSASSDNAGLAPESGIMLASSVDGENSITVSTAANQSGSAIISISASDGENITTESFTLTVNAINDAPNAVADSGITTPEDTTIEIAVAVNDVDPEGDSFSVSAVGLATNGATAISADEQHVVYTPDENFNGSDSFSYTVTDIWGASSSATVTVSVTSVSDAPLAVNDSVNVIEDTTTTIYPLANDVDADILLNGDSLTITSVSEPAHGSIELAVDGLSFEYTPNANSVESEILSYEISDSTSQTSTATVSISITSENDSPSAMADSIETNEDEPIIISVLLNDLDVDLTNGGDTLTITGVDGVTTGEVEIIDSETKLRFTPSTNWNGTTSFTYGIRDVAGATSSNTVTVTVNPVNDAPLISVIDDQTIDEDGSTNALAFSVSDVDHDNSLLTISVSSSDESILNTAGFTLASTLGGDNSITVVPLANQFGEVTVTISATDGSLTSTETFLLTVSAINDNPVVVDDSGIETNEDTAVIINVLTNDSDIESESLTVTAVGEATHGTPSISGGGQTVTYTPTANYNGTDTFTYTVTDSSGGTSTGTVSLTVLTVNDAPSAQNDSTSLNEDVVTIIDVLANDTDIDLTTNPGYETKNLVSVGSPSHGSVVISENKAQYTPSLNYFGTDSFTYTMEDTDHAQSTATVNLTIASINDYPTFSNLLSTYTVNEDESLLVNFDVNDTETTTESLMLQVVSLNQTKVADSKLVLSGLGDSDSDTSLTITPNANENQSVIIKLTLGDGFVTTTQSFTLDITPVNDVPVANADSYNFTEDNSIVIDMDDLVNNDTDIDGDDLTFIEIVAGSLTQGSLNVLNASEHTYTFVPPSNYDNNITFQYVMSDGTVQRTGTVTLRATAVNDPPILTLDAGNPTNLDEDTSAVLAFTINDYETAISLLSVQAGSSDSDILPPDKIVINRNPDGTATMTVTPNADKNGEVTVSLSVSDGVILVQQDIILTVDPIADNPTAMADAITVPMNGSLTFSPMDNDYDVDGNAISISSINTTSTDGSVTGPVDGDLTYDATGALGTDSFTYTIDDGTGRTSTATVTVTITGSNNSPSITGVSNQFINEDTATGDLAFSVSDPDSGSVLSVTKSSDNHALIPDENVVVTSTGANQYTVKVTPLANQSGTATVTLTVTDENEASTSTTFSITVYPINDLPEAVDDSVTTPEDTSLAISAASILSNDIDVDEGTVLQITQVTDPTHGRLSYNTSSKTYTYQPDGNFNGTDSFTYTMTDGEVVDSAVVTITISPVNDSPVAYSNWLTVAASLGASQNVDVRTNDYDIETSDANLIVTIVTQPSYGTAVVEANGTVTYTRSASDNAADWKDSFTYTVQDDNDPPATSNVATVYIDDYWGPSIYADDQWIAMNEDTPTPITLAIHDGYGSGYSVSFPTPSLGTITDSNSNDQYITYIPNLNANGTETIEYTLTSNYTGNPTGNGTIYITIYPINDAPVISPDLDDVTIDEDTSTSNLHVDISDVETNAADLVFTVASSNSDLVLDSGIDVTRENGSIDFVITPLANRFGTTTITLLASDGVEQTTQTFTLTVNSVNDIPVANDLSVTTNEDTSTMFNVISPNADADGDTLTLSTTVSPSHGSVTINGDKTITYTPTLNYAGSDSFTYQLADASSNDTGVVTITVNPVNDPPTILNLGYDYTTIEDTAKTILFKVTDIDNALSSANVSVTRGNTTLLPDGSVSLSGVGEDITMVLTPAANLSGNSTQTVTVSDGNLTVTQDFVLTVSAVNDNPIANNDSATTNEDTATTFNVISNDTDVESGTLSVVSFTNPSKGSIRNNHDGTLTYTPTANSNGSDSFTYTIADVNNGQSTATVSLTVNPVNDAPRAIADNRTIVEDNSVTINLLANDYDIESSPITLTGVNAPGKGTFVNNGDGSITYTPNEDQTGTDSFTYTISDGELTGTGTITITITAVNDAPRLSSSVDRPWTLNEDTVGSFPITIIDPETPSDNLVIKISSSVQSLIPDTSIVLTGSGQNKFVGLTPKLNQFGTLELTFDVNDGVNTTIVVYEVVVQSVNDLPTISNISDQTTIEDTAKGGITFTVSDIETSAAELTVSSATEDGVLIPSENVVVTNGTGGNRTLTLTPAANQVGSTIITLTVHDADGGTAEESFNFTVNAANDAPVAISDTSSVDEDSSVVIDVLANDTDVDLLDEGDTLTIVSTAGVDHATVTLAGDKKTLTFTPEADWNGSETFSYTMKDAAGETSTASVTVQINPVNDNPDAINDSQSTAEDTATTISVLANDTDIDLSREGDVLSIISTANVDHGTATISTDLTTITFTPESNWSGTESFDYTIQDQNGAMDSASVTITVNSVNDGPTISDIANQTVVEDIPSDAISFVVNDIDTLEEDLIITASTSNGTVIPLSGITFGGSGATSTVTLTPAVDKNTWNSTLGIDEPLTITVTVSDGFLSSSDTFSVTVTPVNDAPIALDDSSTTNEDTSVSILVLTNDSDVDIANEGDSITIESTFNVENGNVTIAGDGKSLSFMPAANFFGSEEFDYTIRDSHNATATGSVTVTVNAVNDAPTISDVTNQTIDEDTNTGALTFSIADVDSTITCANITKSSNRTTIIPNANVVIGGSGTNCNVTVTPLANKNTFGQSAVTITLTVSDGTLTNSDTFTVAVTKVNDTPLAVADATVINEDAIATINALTNDTDVDLLNEGDTLTIVSIDGVDNGTAQVAVDHLSISFTPNANWFGTETFDYTITDLAGATSTSTVTVTVNPINDAPTISDISNQTIDEDSNTGLLAFSINDIDDDFSALTVSASTANSTIIPLSGIELTGVDGSRSITVTPDANRNTYISGPITITVSVEDAAGLTASDTFTVTINHLNDAPSAQGDSVTTSEDVAVSIPVIANDLDADLLNEGETLNVISTDGVENGLVSISGDKQSVVFTPAANWSGVETFSYTLEDSALVTSTATVTVTVNAANDAPIAGDDIGAIDEDDSLTLTVLDNDTDIDVSREGDTLTIVSTAGVDHGSVTIASDSLSLTFTPAANWTGTETFTYTIRDTANAQSTADVTITVNPINDIPTAVNDSYTIDEDQAVNFAVLSNDTDVDLSFEGDELIVLSVSAAVHGVASVNSDHHTVDYDPEDNWNGTEVLTYLMEDKDHQQSSATITIVVQEINDAPVAVADSTSTTEDNSIFVDVLLNDTDEDLSKGDVITIVSTSGVDHGTVTIASDNLGLTFTPAENWNGTEEFSYTIRDLENATSSSTVTVTVSAEPDAPTANNDSSTTPEDQSVQINLVTNDTDPDLNNGDVLEITSTSNVDNGVAQISSDKTSVLFTPNLDWNGTEIFSYSIEDSTGNVSSANVSVTVTPVNDAPVANFDASLTNEDVELTLNVLGNDSDVDAGDDLTITAVNNLDHASVTISGDQKSLSFDPDADWNGTETFSYTIRDTAGLTSTANVSVVVSAINDAPVANPDTASVNEDNSITIEVLNNDTDVDQSTNTDSFSIKNISGLDHAEVSFTTGNQALIFTPDTNWNGVEIFDYTIEDAAGLESTSTVTVTVDPQPDSSVANADTANCVEDGSVSIAVLDNDDDFDHTPATKSLTIISISDEVHGSVSIAGDALSLTYTPDVDWNGTDTFTYTIQDANLSTSSAVVTVTVTPVNDAPDAENDSATTDEDELIEIDVLANDLDPDLDVEENDDLLITSISGTYNGAVVIASDQKSLSYTPPENWSGTETFTYTIEDKDHLTSNANVSVAISAVDDAPTFSLISDQTIDEDSSTELLSFTLSDVDSSVDDVEITTSTTNTLITPLGGIVVGGTGANRTIQVTPANNKNTHGISPMTITLWAGEGQTSFDLTIQPVNDPPTAVADSFSLDEDTSLTLDVLANDTDVDLAIEGDDLTILNTSGVDNANVQIINSGKSLRFTPNSDWFGTEQFTYTMQDSDGEQSSATINITVNDISDATATPTVTATPKATSTPKPTSTPTQMVTFKVTSPTGGAYKDGQVVNVTWTPVLGTGVVYKLEFFNGNTWTSLGESLTGTSFAHALNNTKLHTSSAQYRVTATYNGGKTINAQSNSFIIDNVAPQNIKVSLITGDKTSYSGGVVTSTAVTLSATEGWDLTGISIRILEGTRILASGAPGISSVINVPGSHTITVTAIDPLGNNTVIGEYILNILGVEVVATSTPTKPNTTPVVSTPNPNTSNLDDPTRTPEPENDELLILEFPQDPEDPDNSNKTILILPDGTQISLDEDHTWEATEDGDYTYISTDPDGNQHIMIITVTGKEISSIQEIRQTDGVFIPVIQGNAGMVAQGNEGLGDGVKTPWVLPIFGAGLIWLILLLWPNVKIVYYFKDSNGKVRKQTQYKWAIAPDDDELEIKVKDAEAYEVILSRWLTRSVRGGTLTIKPQQFAASQSTVEIPDKTKNRFRANF